MDEVNKRFTIRVKEYHEGDAISIDGSTGKIYAGIIPNVISDAVSGMIP